MLVSETCREQEFFLGSRQCSKAEQQGGVASARPLKQGGVASARPQKQRSFYGQPLAEGLVLWSQDGPDELSLGGGMGVLEEVSDLAEAVVRRRSLKVWDVEMGGSKGSRIVRVYVDGDDGVDLDTVAQVSEEISRGLDLRDPIEGRYTLEVSSPGLERSLKRPEHYARSVGQQVVVKTKNKVAGDSHRVDGTILEARDDSVKLKTDQQDEVDVPYDEVKSARTVFEWR